MPESTNMFSIFLFFPCVNFFNFLIFKFIKQFEMEKIFHLKIRLKKKKPS